MACPETPTPCEQAALNLASIEAKILRIASGEGLKSIGEADKSMARHDPDLKMLDNLRRRYQAQVDRCNGCTGTSQRFIQMTPSDC